MFRYEIKIDLRMKILRCNGIFELLMRWGSDGSARLNTSMLKLVSEWDEWMNFEFEIVYLENCALLFYSGAVVITRYFPSVRCRKPIDVSWTWITYALPKSNTHTLQALGWIVVFFGPRSLDPMASPKQCPPKLLSLLGSATVCVVFSLSC